MTREVTMELRRIRDAEDARRCLAAVRDSGEDRAAWARRNGVDPRSLNAWRINLDRSAPGPRLLELVPRRVEVPQSVLVIRCGPFAVDVPNDVDESVLTKVLAVLAAC